MTNIPSMTEHAILTGRICAYCNIPTYLIDSFDVYGKSYGWLFRCNQCFAYVGCHKGTKKPLGRVADLKLRKAKNKAHRHFDQLWRRKDTKTARSEAYKWLSEEMGIHPDYTHIGMFNLEQCAKVVDLCKPYIK